MSVEDTVRIACTLEGDSAIDFERLLMELKVQQMAPTKQKQHAMLVAVALLVLDACKRSYSSESGKRYPSVEEVLRFAGVGDKDAQRVREAILHSGKDQMAAKGPESASESPSGPGVDAGTRLDSRYA